MNADTIRRAEIEQKPLTATSDPVRPGESTLSLPENAPLLPPEIADEFIDRWNEVQTAFVDDPLAAVQQADELLAYAIRKLSESFSEERAKLESQWAGGSNGSTEDLRLALQRYRIFFHRLLHL